MQVPVRVVGSLGDGVADFQAYTGVVLINDGAAATLVFQPFQLVDGDVVCGITGDGTSLHPRVYRVVNGEYNEFDTPLTTGDQIVVTCGTGESLVQSGQVFTVTDDGFVSAAGTGQVVTMWPLLSSDLASQVAALSARIDELVAHLDSLGV